VRSIGKLLDKSGPKLRVLVLVETGRSFLHAKIFAARKAKQAEILVGSFNLTGGGLTSNHEFAAHLESHAGAFFSEIRAFINSVQGTKELTSSNYAAVADELTPIAKEPADTELAEKRRTEAKKKLDALVAALGVPKKGLAPDDQVPEWTDELLASGRFLTYSFDTKKLTIPSGLDTVYTQGLLPKEKSTTAGTAKMRVATGISANYALVPPRWQQRYTGVAKRLAKALSSYGFHTAYGHWVPNAYQADLKKRCDVIASSMPDVAKVAKDIRVSIEAHRTNLEETTDAILKRAIIDGVQEPSKWHTRDAALLEIALAARKSTEVWRNSELEVKTRAVIRHRLLSVKEKLDAELAIAKLGRLRPEVLPVPIDPTAQVIRVLLEAMVWSVAEDRGKRKSRPAARKLSERLPNKNPAASLDKLDALSASLIEELPGAERTFFSLFGSPPYWTVEASGETEEEDDDDADDDDDA